MQMNFKIKEIKLWVNFGFQHLKPERISFKYKAVRNLTYHHLWFISQKRSDYVPQGQIYSWSHQYQVNPWRGLGALELTSPAL